VKVFSAVSIAMIRIRASRSRKLTNSRTDEDKSATASQYEFGRVLKETMLNLGPTFIKGQTYP